MDQVATATLRPSWECGGCGDVSNYNKQGKVLNAEEKRRDGRKASQTPTPMTDSLKPKSETHKLQPPQITLVFCVLFSLGMVGGERGLLGDFPTRDEVCFPILLGTHPIPPLDFSPLFRLPSGLCPFWSGIF